MNAVWLNDELMVSPSAVAGLVCHAEDDLYMGYWSIWRQIDVVLVGGDRLKAWGDVARAEGITLENEASETAAHRARTKAAAEAEVERLSALLWPPELPPLRLNTLPDIRIFDPELYGLPVCGVERSYAGVICRCDLAANHHLAGRPEHRFPDADPL